MIEEECNEATRAALRERGLWTGEAGFHTLADVYNRAAGAIDAHKGEFNPKWPYRLACYAQIVLAARSAAAKEADKDAQQPAKPTVQSVRSLLGA